MVFQVVGFHSLLPSLFYTLTPGSNSGVHLRVCQTGQGDRIFGVSPATGANMEFTGCFFDDGEEAVLGREPHEENDQA